MANLATPDARRLQLLRSEAEQGGAGRDDPCRRRCWRAIGDLLAAKAEVVAFAANATVIRRQDQMLGSLLDREV